MSFTIHNLDEELDAILSERARTSGRSKNKLVKDILAEAVGLPRENGFSDDYGEFCGIWTAAEEKEFDRTQAENRRIDKGDWE
jgi:hypothetical protein